MKIRIEFDKSKCIGAGQCRLSDPIDFVFDPVDDFHTVLNESEKQGDSNIWVKELETPDHHMPTNAGIHCPVKAIRVINLETGEVKAPKESK
ncbi:TPA: ferredoxin [archaeon]|uniref:Ferredoxin n=1 Tax=Candidatus Naiadarchaeum limnaeum TaxID=2756139 RepID=A0A832USY2_9ARCH|nr:ferredoxin [Candidatus Naiadarchaeum limnaeum]